MKISFGTLLKGAAVIGGALVGLIAVKTAGDYQNVEAEEPAELSESEATTEIEAEGETKEEEKKDKTAK